MGEHRPGSPGARERSTRARAPPAGAAHGAIAELSAGHARLEKAPAIAGTLIYRGDLNRLESAFEIVEAKLQRPAYGAADFETVGRRVDRQRQIGKVIAHVKCVVRGNDPFVEDLKGRFELWRSCSVALRRD